MNDDNHEMNRAIIASVSGGKDSTAMCLHLLEEGIPFRAVHMDTQWESSLTDEYIRDVLDPAIGPIEWIASEGFAALCCRKGAFPSRVGRFCTEQLKMRPFLSWLEAEYPDTDITNAIGIRHAESTARSALPEREAERYGEVWRPIIEWTEADVIAIHARHGLPPNPLYLRGANRVGCWPCIFASKAEIRLLAEIDNRRVDEIRELEAEVERSAAARYAAKGETFESLGYHAPRLFMPPGRLRSETGGRMPTIDEVVAWSKTSRGGRQYELFARDKSDGCLRWGMCE